MEFQAASAYFKKEFPNDNEVNEFINDGDFSIRDNINLIDFIENDKKRLLGIYYETIIYRTLSAGFEAYIIGNYTKSIKLLNKTKFLTPYEKLILNYMKSSSSSKYHVPNSIYKNITELYSNGIPKNNAKEALALFPSLLVLGLLWSPFYLLLYFIFYYFSKQDCLYLTGVLMNSPSVIIPAILISIPTIYFNSKRFYKIFFSKNYEKLIQLDKIAEIPSTRTFMKYFSSLIFILSILFIFLTVNKNFKMLENGFYDNSDFFTISGDYHDYDEIKSIEEYTIYLKDGTTIHSDIITEYDTEFVEILNSKGIKFGEK